MTDTSTMNISGWLFYLLASVIAYGFFIRFMSNRMKSDKTILPAFDIPDMIIKAFKMIPFNFVWGIYLGLYAILVALLVSFLAKGSESMLLVVLLVLPFILLVQFAWPILIAVHTKSFKYKGLLNPFVLLMIFPRIFGPMFLTYLCVALLYIVIFALGFGTLMLLGVSSAVLYTGVAGLNEVGTMVGVGIVAVVFYYFLFVANLALNLRFCDIAKERLEDFEILDSDYYDEDEDEPKAVSDEELYSGYMRNKDDESVDY